MAFHELKPNEVVGPGEHWITVTSGMNGYFAVDMWMNNEDPDFVFPEPWDTGIGRYQYYESAKQEAMEMAEDYDLPYTF